MKHKKIHTAQKGNVDLHDLCNEIKLKTGLRLMADDQNSVVDGYINVVNGEVQVYIYDENESPNQRHETTLNKPTVDDAKLNKVVTTIQNHSKVMS